MDKDPRILFDRQIDTRTLKGIPRRRELVADFSFHISGKTFIIGKGFWTDFASYHRVLYTILGSPYDSDIAFAALIHDTIYATHIFSRKEADIIFYHVLIACGASKLKAATMYRAVRMFGGSSYNKKPEEIAGAIKHLTIDGQPASSLLK